ncbi:spermidine/putrescine ABC transporter permease (plasmid) [Kozakia baliensis]|uniref:Spermidine/putrescine ABC transporter permease n=1 Tax=Kozakia baliensis TaxID=153496 RepID=A0A1D8UY94_9PROT|nr:ABC transporter permease [Kozakia baliensis]AOX18594.1 spermidine/putrescine ABC transporter permease [Kozakia baliensis]
MMWRILIIALYAFLLAPLVVVLIVSFDTRPYLSFPPATFSLGSYSAVLHDAGFRSAALLSLVIGIVSAGLSLLLGTAVSFALARGRIPGRQALQWLFLSPMLVPHIVLAVGLMMTLQPLGLLDTVSGLILAHIGITLPYTTRIISSGMAALDRETEQAAMLHGATLWQTVRRVTLPALRPSLVAAGLIAFLFSFDEAVIALFIAGDKATTLPLAIYKYIQFRTDPQVAALSVLVVLVSAIPVLVIERNISLKRALGA